jgi:Polysaccharide lyase
MGRELGVLLKSAMAAALIACAGCGMRTGSAPQAPPATATPPAPAVTFFCSFAASPSDCGFGEQAKSPGRARVVSGALVGVIAGLTHIGLESMGRDGPTSVRLHTEPGDSNVAGSLDNERNDLSLSQAASDCFEGREHWWAHSVLFPDDYVDPPQSTGSAWNWATVFDFHNTAPGAGQPNFQVIAWPATAISGDRPTGLGFQIAYGNQANPTMQRFPIDPLVRNMWYDFVYHVKWSSGPGGFFTAWVNGAKKMDYSGPTLYPGQGCYLKLANYHTPFGKPSSVIHDRVIRGAAAGAVSPVPLE